MMEYNRNLTPYQMVHLLKLRSNGLNGLLIADGVGVGKTISAGYIIEYTLKVLNESCIVCCPPVLEQKWIEELNLRFARTAYSVKEKENYDRMIEELNDNNFTSRVYILPYSMAKKRDFSKLNNVGCVIFDEIHHARNKETQLFEKLIDMSIKSTYKVGLSATPIHNSLSDLASIMRILFPVVSLEAWNLIIKEIWARKKVSILHPFITKFDKSELGIHFTQRNINSIEIDYPASYNNSVKSALEKKGKNRGKDLSSFEKSIFLRLASSSPAAFFNSMNFNLPDDYIDEKLSKLITLINSSAPGRWIIFTEFKITAKLISEKLKNYQHSVISGESTFSERYIAIDDFKKNPNGIIIMMPVGCEGLDLQICSRLINYDLHWNPMVIEQRIGRIDRIGQSKDVIQIYNFLVLGSIDYHMLSIMREKIGIVADTFAGIDSLLEKNSSSSLPVNDITSDLWDSNNVNLINEFSEALPNTDYELQGLLSKKLCEIEYWPKKPSEWDNVLSLFGEAQSQNKINNIRQESIKLFEILSDYM